VLLNWWRVARCTAPALVWTVIYVPAVRDTVNIAALIASTKWVDEDYTATQIGDERSDRSTREVSLSDGYFAARKSGLRPSGSRGRERSICAKIISQWKPGGPDPEETPSPSPDASPSASPSPAASTSPAVAQASSSPALTPARVPGASPLTQEEAQKELEKTAAQNDVTLPDENQINKKPLKDFATRANELKNQGKLDLNKPFRIVILAELSENTKLQKFPRCRKRGR
jgi:hypothetical protein